MDGQSLALLQLFAAMQGSPTLMNFIVAGVGFWGRKWIELLQEHPHASVVAAIDKNDSAAEWSQQSYHIPCFPELSTAAAKVSADVVLVVTNPSQHKPVILQAVGLGKHVLIEKPMVTSMAEAAEVAAAAEHASGLIMVAQGYRFLEAAALVRECLVAGDLGDLQADQNSVSPAPTGCHYQPGTFYFRLTSLDPARYVGAPHRSSSLHDSARGHERLGGGTRHP
jgi:predicted dehydrogenase